MERTKRAIGREMRGRSKRKSIVLTTWWNNFSLSLSYKRRKTRLRGVLRIWEDEVLSVGVSSSLPLSILCSILTQGRRWSICSRRKPVSSRPEVHHYVCVGVWSSKLCCRPCLVVLILFSTINHIDTRHVLSLCAWRVLVPTSILSSRSSVSWARVLIL